MTKKKVLAGAGAAATLILIGAAAPRAARAVYTTPVTVFNTTAQPVESADTEKMARVPYLSSVTPQSCASGVGACFFFFSSPPAGYRLVVENIVGYFQVSPVATAPLVGYIETGNPQFRILGSFTGPLGQIDPGGHIQVAVNQPTRFYVDASDPGFLAVASSNWANGSSAMVATGYLENCSISGCPAVQH
jgi:hypothetical protein